MGIGRMAANLLIAEGKARPFSGRVLQLGRQDVGYRPEGYDGPLEDEPFLEWLGFDTVHSCDVSDYERPTFVADLNRNEFPVKYFDFYDVVLDGGTLEHVFDQLTALRNIHKLLSVGGRVVHVNGVSNWVEHGFYSFSPCFWWDYYAANRYRIEDCLMICSTADENAERHVYRYRPGCIDDVQRGNFGGPLFVWECWFVATKTAESTSGVIPQQRRLSALWEGKPPSGGGLEYVGTV